MKENKYFSVHKIALIGILAAAIFVLTKFVSIPIPSPLGKTALSVGNALVDLSDPAWAPEFWITFINKFLMTFVAGLVMHKVKLGRENIRIWFAGLLGALTYSLLYVAKNIVLGVVKQGFTWEVAIVETLTLKLPVSLANGVIAVICAGLLYLILKQPLRKAHVLQS